MIDLITITQGNAAWAVSENFRRIYEELQYKIPINNSRVTLKSDVDGQGLYTIRGISAAGPGSGVSQLQSVES